MRVLIVKTSSLGDVVHTLPAVTDAMKNIPGISFDWVVEEGFSEIPSWHPAVDTVIPVALRRWRKNKKAFLKEFSNFKRLLRSAKYDLVIDAQGLIKSAFITRLAKGPRYGLDKNSARESMASLVYKYKINVPKDNHAVQRTRLLFSKALGYDLSALEKPSDITSSENVENKDFSCNASSPGCNKESVERNGLSNYLKDRNINNIIDYGLQEFRSKLLENSKEKAIIFLHGTTWVTKHYPESHWIALAKQVIKIGYKVKLPWGNQAEFDRAQRIADAAGDSVIVLPKCSLVQVAEYIGAANAVVAVDTGLGHLTAALGVPCVSLYGPTDPNLVGAMGMNQVHLKGSPCAKGCGSKLCTRISTISNKYDRPAAVSIGEDEDLSAGANSNNAGVSTDSPIIDMEVDKFLFSVCLSDISPETILQNIKSFLS